MSAGAGNAATTDWDRVARLPAAHLATRLGLTYVGPCPGGEVGAAYVRWPDGRRSVLTGGSPTAASIVETARAAGLPAARYEFTTQVDGRCLVVQERLPGTPPTTVDRSLVDQMLALNERCAGLFANSDVPQLPLYLRRSGPGFCLHDPIAAYCPRAATLLEWARSLDADVLPAMISSTSTSTHEPPPSPTNLTRTYAEPCPPSYYGCAGHTWGSDSSIGPSVTTGLPMSIAGSM